MSMFDWLIFGSRKPVEVDRVEPPMAVSPETGGGIMNLQSSSSAEQWQEIIDGGYLVEVSQNDSYYSVGELARFKPGEEEKPFIQKLGAPYKYCRPAQLKGVMRPIFVEPLDKDVYTVMFDRDNTAVHDGNLIRYSFLNALPNIKRKATKYIEV